MNTGTIFLSGIANNLMRYGADPNLKDFEKGMTALHYGQSFLPCACERVICRACKTLVSCEDIVVGIET